MYGSKPGGSKPTQIRPTSANNRPRTNGTADYLPGVWDAHTLGGDKTVFSLRRPVAFYKEAGPIGPVAASATPPRAIPGVLGEEKSLTQEGIT